MLQHEVPGRQQAVSGGAGSPTNPHFEAVGVSCQRQLIATHLVAVLLMRDGKGGMESKPMLLCAGPAPALVT